MFVLIIKVKYVPWGIKVSGIAYKDYLNRNPCWQVVLVLSMTMPISLLLNLLRASCHDF
jgi:hypothetical protein